MQSMDELYNRTVPLKGWQYMTSLSQPCLATHGRRGDKLQQVTPTPPQRRCGDLAEPAASAPCGQQCMTPTAQRTVSPTATTKNNVSPSLPRLGISHSNAEAARLEETIERMSPSVRRLLHIDDNATATAHDTQAAAQKLLSRRDEQANRHGHTSHSVTVSRAATRGASSNAPRQHEEMGQRMTLLSSTLARRCGRQTRKNDIQALTCDSSGWAATLTRRPGLEPPIVTTLREYVAKEMMTLTVDGNPLTQMGGTEGMPADQLGPYREAFAALIAALPSYAGLLNDIRSAYDGVIQAQAELLTEAYAREADEAARASRAALSAQAEERAQQLARRVRDLERELQTVRKDLEQRSGTSAMLPTEFMRNQQRNYAEMAKQLEQAQERAAALERSSKGDLEKILVLIGAVRECDRRIKRFEDTVHKMSGQIEELDEFKRLAGEAQSELQRYKDHYVQYVACSDFELMKEHLTKELSASQAIARRLRRTAAVRATQNDVLQRRLRQLETDKAVLVQALTVHSPSQARPPALSALAEDANAPQSPTALAGAATRATPTTMTSCECPLTPRPDWSAIHRELAALREEVKDVHSAPLDQLTAPTTTPAAPAADGDHQANSVTSLGGSGDVLVVAGPRETSLQVEFMVEQIRSLQAELRRSREECTSAVEALRELQAARPPPVTLASSSMTGRAQSQSPLQQQQQQQRLASGGGGHSNGGGTAGQAWAMTNSGWPDRGSRTGSAHGGALSHELSGLTRVEELDVLIGPGVGSQVPVYLRACGVLPRIIVSEKARVRLIFDFFFSVVQPLFEQPYSAATDVQAMYGRFLQQQMEQQDNLGEFRSAAHLALNLEEDAHVSSLATPPLVLLVRILHGLMPVRLAVDAVALVAHVMATLTKLAEEQKKTRLRREAISECLRPILELMTQRELNELRVALGNDTTYDAIVLASMESRFMRTLFFQACQSGMDLYLDILRGLTRRAVACDEDDRSNDGTLTLADVAEVVQTVEPATPQIILRELSETALKMLSDDSVSGSSTTNNATSSASANQAQRVYLSEIIRAIGESPIIRRTAQCSREQCTL